MRKYPKSAMILKHNSRFIPGGVSSITRMVKPEIAFVKGQGAYLWDAEGNRYIDYHAAFAPHVLGHNDPEVTEAVVHVLRSSASLYGSGATELEGELAELICSNVPAAESVELLNTGSEATAQAIRLARAATGRDHVIVMQGDYNGWHNDVSCNLMTPLSELGPRVSPGEYPYISISAGVPEAHKRLVHPINFNDLASVEYVCEQREVAALITEPVLQNIGIVKPDPGYLEGLRRLADRYGFVLIFDEVKTGFRHSVGGYSSLCGVIPDLIAFGKAVANGYPMGVLAGKRALLDGFVHPDPAKRVLLAGTYNGHPVPVAAAIATIKILLKNDGYVYRHLEALSSRMEEGLREIIRTLGLTAVVSRQGSAFCLYFMNHLPRDWHDLAENHNFGLDENLRQALIENGVYFYPLAIKQCSISFAHTESDIDATLSQMEIALRPLAQESAH